MEEEEGEGEEEEEEEEEGEPSLDRYHPRGSRERPPSPELGGEPSSPRSDCSVETVPETAYTSSAGTTSVMTRGDLYHYGDDMYGPCPSKTKKRRARTPLQSVRPSKIKTKTKTKRSGNKLPMVSPRAQRTDREIAISLGMEPDVFEKTPSQKPRRGIIGLVNDMREERNSTKKTKATSSSEPPSWIMMMQQQAMLQQQQQALYISRNRLQFCKYVI